MPIFLNFEMYLYNVALRVASSLLYRFSADPVLAYLDIIGASCRNAQKNFILANES